MTGELPARVCASHLYDEALSRFTAVRPADRPCDVCGDEEATQADVDHLFDYVYESLQREYGDPSAGSLLWDQEDGEWLGVNLLDTADVLWEVGAPLGDGGDPLHDLFCERFVHDWYELDSEVGTFPKRLVWSWQSFQERILSGPRFLFLREYAAQGEVSVEEVFRQLARSAAFLQTAFVKHLDAGTEVWRARRHASEHFHTPAALGSPPVQLAVPQRLSPAGVSYFYGSEDLETVKVEVRPGATDQVSAGAWRTTTRIRYLDLADLPALPSLFDASFANTRPLVLFLRGFAGEVAKPIDAERVPANDYLATQILSEYFRWYLPNAHAPGVEAIRYPSALTGAANWVFFLGPEDCGAEGSGSALELLRSRNV